jgi:hypothetical protein
MAWERGEDNLQEPARQPTRNPILLQNPLYPNP